MEISGRIIFCVYLRYLLNVLTNEIVKNKHCPDSCAVAAHYANQLAVYNHKESVRIMSILAISLVGPHFFPPPMRQYKNAKLVLYYILMDKSDKVNKNSG